MDSAQMIVTAGGIGLIAFTLWFFFGKRGEGKEGAKGKPYACPMHPWITSSDPTENCSVCGMKLVRSDEIR